MGANSEILLLAGPPGSGKTTIGRKFVDLNLLPSQHVSIGDLKRSIESGETPSAYREALLKKEYADRSTGSASSGAMIGILREALMALTGALTLLDGFPRYHDRIKPFKDLMGELGCAVVALCVVDVPRERALQRLQVREARPSQELGKPEYAHKRLDDYYANIMPTIELLATDYPRYVLDGTDEPLNNAYALHDVYRNATQSDTE